MMLLSSLIPGTTYNISVVTIKNNVKSNPISILETTGTGLIFYFYFEVIELFISLSVALKSIDKSWIQRVQCRTIIENQRISKY